MVFFTVEGMVMYRLDVAIKADLKNCRENSPVQAHRFLPQPCKNHKEVETKHPSSSLAFNEKKYTCPGDVNLSLSSASRDGSL